MLIVCSKLVAKRFFYKQQSTGFKRSKKKLTLKATGSEQTENELEPIKIGSRTSYASYEQS
jgi:hypothetical protein